jgi:mRNA interferase MazF
MRRGDLVSIALQGDSGKPHLALVIQSGLFDGHPSVTLLPVTGELREAPLFRITVQPDAGNGLAKPSQIMVDKLQTVPRGKVGLPFGHIDDASMVATNRALAVFLGFAD